MKVKRLIIPSVFVLSVSLVIGSIIWLVSAISKYLTIPLDYNYSVDGLYEEEKTIPVVNDDTTIIKPYFSENVTIGKYFYDFEGDNKSQENSLIYYENTYMQNSGVDYISEEEFEVVSVLDGEIIKIEEDETLGTIVEIKHDEEIITVYQGMKDVALKTGDTINQGDIIGKSSESKINSNYKNALHFEVYYKGKLIDPESFYSLDLKDLDL